ncbi:FecR domain-containing protein [bacterium]|nr:FecR domain-containing protein [bacterium]
MFKTALVGLFLLSSIGNGWAQEPVLRLVDMQAQGTRPSVQQRKPSDPKWYPAYVGAQGSISDHFKTDTATVAALEFFIGGRVGVARDTDIEIVTDRSVSSIGPRVKRVVLHHGLLWMKSNRPLSEPLEIQTNGGTLGIKGTEFTVESKADESTKVAVLHGAVEVRDEKRKYLGLAEAGDVYELHAGSEHKYWKTPLEELKADTARQFRETYLDQVAFSMDEDGGVQRVQQATQEVKEGIQLGHNALKELNEKINSIRTKGDEGYYLASPYREAIRSGVGPAGGSSLAPATPTPSATDTLFTWKEYPGADGYVIFVSDKLDFKNILYSDRVRDTRTVYPSLARPLAPGQQYFWRVIPVQADDSVVAGAQAAQATFTVSR